MTAPVEREIRRFLARVRGARFVGALCEALLVAVLGLATVLLCLRLCGVSVSAAPWWGLLAVPVLAWAWLGVRRLDFGHKAGAAHLDRRLGLDGLLVTALECDTAAYQGRLQSKLREAKQVLPRLSLRPLFARLGVALLVLAVVLLLPAPTTSARTNSMAADVLHEYEEKLAELAENGGVTEEVREELAQRLNALEKNFEKSGDVSWKDLDAFAQAAEHERALHAARLSKSQQDLAAFARGDDPSTSGGPDAESRRMSQLIEEAQAAGLLDQLPDALKDRLADAQGADGTDGAQSGASLDAETLKQMAAALAQAAGDRLSALQGAGLAPGTEALSLDALLEGTDVEALFGKPCTMCAATHGEAGEKDCPG